MENTIVNKKIRQGDKVIVIAGNEKGQTGIVQARTHDRVIVQGLNRRKKCHKRSQLRPKGDITEIEAPIHASNVQICSDENAPLKLKVSIEKKGGRQLVYKAEGQKKVYRSLKKPK